MSAIKLSASAVPLKSAAAVVVAVTTQGKGLVTLPDVGFSPATLKALGAAASLDSVVRTIGSDGRVYVLTGLPTDMPSLNELRHSAGAVGRVASDISSLEFHIPTASVAEAIAVLEGAALGAYAYPKTAKTKVALSAVHLVTQAKISKANIDEVAIVARATHGVRVLANTPANHLYPELFANKAVAAAAAQANLRVQVWDEKQLKKDGFGAIAGVGQGSVRGPRLVKLVYAPKGATQHLALVGKGITFDTGGYAIKPLGGMLGMKYDMSGAATAFQAILAVSRLGLPVKVTAWLCLAENMVSGSALKPGDVITAKNGKTIEVTNPDAEGRLVMADGLSAASLDKPDLIVDIATLTGAARIALGIRYTGLMGTNEGVLALQKAADAVGEQVWHMPLPVELRDNLKSDVADLANAKVGNTFGGMLVAGHFLSEFVGKGIDGSQLPWAHLDIAGPADNESGAFGYTPKGPTGVMLRTLVQTARDMSK